MNYHDKKYTKEMLNKRAYILSSFTRQKITLSVSIYEFTDYLINKGWLPELNDLNDVDKEIMNKYNEYMNTK